MFEFARRFEPVSNRILMLLLAVAATRCHGRASQYRR